MLSRTAENLFWIGRYLERAEANARLLEVGARNALLPNIGGGYRNEWESVLVAGGTYAAFREKYGDAVQRNIESHMFFDKDNPSSILSCVTAARENGRIVRTAITGQVWDALNGAFQEIREMQRTERSQLPLADLTDWTMRTAALVRGATQVSMLRNDGFQFLRLGYAVERADNTARLLDVKYYVLLPEVTYVGTGLDNYQWTTLLRALSSYRAFNHAYGGEITAWKIAEFLILNTQCPRSLLSCVSEVNESLDVLARAYHRTTGAQTEVRGMLGELAEARVDDILREGLHEFLQRFIDRTRRLAEAIRASYLTGRIA
ncbi:alpha-E domain-containing protein [Psychromarinibacter sp. C21-152]|uniref:Alpha-E domain-containing protein n=1 Tax=Psychromarinibacter sediminicola TaxID=3033385 RepID=A0AAE3NQ62_9RHOB|nr:alpha-E domain-containing protein [Psychromarinibacter sediminicola]MDF0600396.1 alpha-E domain-containing protein [Psychromarinibacter sediminicola]